MLFSMVRKLSLSLTEQNHHDVAVETRMCNSLTFRDFTPTSMEQQFSISARSVFHESVLIELQVYRLFSPLTSGLHSTKEFPLEENFKSTPSGASRQHQQLPSPHHFDVWHLPPAATDNANDAYDERQGWWWCWQAFHESVHTDGTHVFQFSHSEDSGNRVDSGKFVLGKVVNRSAQRWPENIKHVCSQAGSAPYNAVFSNINRVNAFRLSWSLVFIASSSSWLLLQHVWTQWNL